MLCTLTIFCLSSNDLHQDVYNFESHLTPLQVRAEKPAWYLAVISGALLRTLDFVAARSAEYLGYLEKGQLPPARLTLTAFEESFVLDGEARAHSGPYTLPTDRCKCNERDTSFSGSTAAALGSRVSQTDRHRAALDAPWSGVW